MLFLRNPYCSARQLTNGGGERLHRERLEQTGVEAVAAQLRHDALLVCRHSHELRAEYGLVGCRRSRRCAAYAAHYLAAVHLRHLDVGEHDVRILLHSNPNGFVGVYGRRDVELHAVDAPKHLVEKLTLQAVVVYYHHGNSGLRC